MQLAQSLIQDAAFLSSAVYNDDPSADIGNGWHLLSYNVLGNGLNEFDFGRQPFDSIFTYDHFNAQAFVAKKGTTLALVFRGSEFNHDVIPLIDFIDAAYRQSQHYAYFDELIASFNAYASGHGYDVLVTGHSLGAAMAEV